MHAKYGLGFAITITNLQLAMDSKYREQSYECRA